MKFLILGCNGMTGHMISAYLLERGHDVMGFARSQSSLVRTIVGDANDKKTVFDVLHAGCFDVVVNCIGILNQFAEKNKAEAVFLNSYFPHFIAEVVRNIPTQIIHISTDCVFSGQRGQYREDDFRDGMSFYDRSKALGELEYENSLTLRQSIVGPDIKPEGIGLLNWFMQQQGEVQGYTRAIWTGQTTLQLAKTIEAAAQERICGLYHMVPDSSISKYDLLVLFNIYLRKNEISVIPNDTIISDKSLNRTRFAFDYRIPDYEQMVAELAGWMSQHQKLYSHYYR